MADSRLGRRLRTAVLAMLAAYAQEAVGAAWQFQPVLQLSGTADDNPRLRSAGADTEVAWEAVAGLTAQRVSEVFEVRAAASLGYTAYSGSDMPEDEDAQILQLETAWRSDRSIWRTGAEYHRDTTLMDVVALQEVQDPGGDIDVALVEENIRRERLLLTTSFRHALTERFDGLLRYDGTYLDYGGGDGGALRDSWTHRLEGRGIYRVSERTEAGLGVEAMRFRPSGSGGDIDSVSLMASATHWVSELSSIGLMVGGWRAEASGGNGWDDDETGFLARLSGRTRGELWSATLTLERSLRPSGEGVLREADQLMVRVSRRISPRLQVLLFGRAYDLRAVATADDRADRRYWEVEPRVEWLLSPAWSIGAFYRYRSVDRNAGWGSADSNAVTLTLEYRPPMEAGRL